MDFIISFFFFLLLLHLLALTIQFDPTEYTGDEGKNVSVTAVLNRPADRVITVTLMTKDDSATCKSVGRELWSGENGCT